MANLSHGLSSLATAAAQFAGYEHIASGFQTQNPSESESEHDFVDDVVHSRGPESAAVERARSNLVAKWLNDNYEECDGISVPRSSLYNYYLEYCERTAADPVNAASFGKLIRGVFPFLKTRRLGTRGQSKLMGRSNGTRDGAGQRDHHGADQRDREDGYHYCGIRLKASSSIRDYSKTTNFSPSKLSTVEAISTKAPSSMKLSDPALPLDVKPEEKPPAHTFFTAFPATPSFSFAKDAASQASWRDFSVRLKSHYEKMADSLLRQKMLEVEVCIQNFWGTPTGFPDLQLFALPEVIDYILQCDDCFGRACIQIVMPNVLARCPIALLQAIRHFAKILRLWISNSMRTAFPAILVQKRVAASALYGMLLRRYSAVNHLAQAASSVLENDGFVYQMIQDWNRLDMDLIRETGEWIAQCDEEIVLIIEKDVRYILQRGNKLEHWTTWIDNLVSKFVDGNIPSNDYVAIRKRARTFMLQWTYFSNLAIRDITLRAASSFSSFHVLRSTLDEYVYLLVEQRIYQHPDAIKYVRVKENGVISIVDEDRMDSAGGDLGVFGVGSFSVELPNGSVAQQPFPPTSETEGSSQLLSPVT